MDDVFWVDEVGDMLEAEGIDPGCIFEFHLTLGPDLEPGGVVVSTGQPGKVPTFDEVERVIIKHVRDGLLTMPRNRPIFATRAHLILPTLC